MANKVQFGQSGWNARPTRRLYIVNGSKLVTAEKQQAFLRPAEVITSGEVVNRAWSSDEEVFSKAAASTATAVYFANADSSDWDVQACGKLPAIYAGDDFEIQTPFFDSESTTDYVAGTPLYIKSVTINGEAYSGVTSDASVGGPIVGIVSKGIINLGSYANINANVAYNNSGEAQPTGAALSTGAYTYQNAHIGMDAAATVNNGVINGGPRVWTNDTGSQYVLQFYTKYIPAAATTTEG